jgi:hypothetical protein
MATPKLVAAANGSARAAVRAIGADGVTIIATDTISAVVRQVARRIAVEPVRAVMTTLDSVPVRSIARDARGWTIADATLTMTPSNVAFDGPWAVPTSTTAAVFATITPTLTGIALPANNPLAPQIGPLVDQSQLNIIAADTAVAGTTPRTITVPLVDSTGVPAAGKWVRFGVSFGTVQDSVQADPLGVVTLPWQAPDIVGPYTLTGVRSASSLLTFGDSTGRIVVQQTLYVKEDVASATKSTIQISATTIAAGMTATITVRVKDKFGNLVRTTTPADFVLAAAAGGGTFSGASCSSGVCQVTYTAPAAPGTDTISAKIGGVDILFSPITLTIN